MFRDPRPTGHEFPSQSVEDTTDDTAPAAAPRRTPGETLGHLLLETVMTAAQASRFRYAPGLCVVIEAPTPAWVEPLRSAAAAMAAWDLSVAMVGDPHRFREAAADAERIARALNDGHRLVVVSHAPGRHLPPSLVAIADVNIRTGPPTPAMIRKAIRDATGVEPGVTSERLGDRLDFFDLVSAIRVGSDLRTCLRRLGSASANRAVVDRFPVDAIDLASQQMDGEAAAWAGRLVADVDAWRRGEIADFTSMDRHAVLCGPRGTAKSGLVAAIARSADLPLIATSVPAWFTDGTPSADGVLRRALAAFARAADASPAILLLDGIDAIPCRDPVGSGDLGQLEPIVGTIGRFLHGTAAGLPSSSKLIVIGTARSGDALDAGLVRPGRLSRIIEIPPPDERAILRRHLGRDLDGLCLDDVVTPEPGASIADWVGCARRRARIAKRPMTIGDLVAEASTQGNRSPASLQRGVVHETFRSIEVRDNPSSPGTIPDLAAGGHGDRPATAERPNGITPKGHRTDHGYRTGRRVGGRRRPLPQRGKVGARTRFTMAVPASPTPLRTALGTLGARAIRPPSRAWSPVLAPGQRPGNKGIPTRGAFSMKRIGRPSPP